jgi:hypothetical protein
MAHTIIAVFADGRKLVNETSTGPASYSTGGFAITVSGIKVIDKIIAITNNGGYISDPADATIALNVVTVLVREFQYACLSSFGASELASARPLTATTFGVLCIGT